LTADDEPRSTVIQPTRGLAFLDLRELWEYRELIYFLSWRDVKVRYKQTAIGVAWAVVQPLALMVVFTLFFGRLAKFGDEIDIPYPVFAYAGLLPWQLFSRTLSETTNSLVTDQRLVTKVYFPRIIVPTSYCVAAALDFLIGSVLLVGMMVYYQLWPTAAMLWLPLFMVLMLTTSLGVGFWLSALNTEYRDVMYVVPFLVQFWLFVTPVVYPSTIVPERLRLLLGINPMTGVVEGMRWALFGYGDGPGPMLWVSAAVSVALFFTGIVWFRMRERTFVDSLGGQ
jgi:lipopolysaccharide transport system permease protein